ncbi:MAG: hypothetical protein JEZ09_15440 [Salinivirgaceae bacterium]|nr:hypothetical protein [Salinivirgaceae bacterium]
MKVPFCASNLDEWKALWPAFIFKEALWDEAYDIYEEDELYRLLIKMHLKIKAL